MPIKTFKYRLYPTPSQARAMRLQLDVARNFYNMCVGERKWAWELEQRSVTKNQQRADVKHYKRTFPQATNVHSHVLQVVAADVDKAFQAFFGRIKKGEKPGYPRFKGYHRFQSFGFKEYGNGFKIDGRRLRVSGVGRVRVRWHRAIEGKIKTCRIKYDAGKWFVSFVCEVPEKSPLPKTGNAVGLDVGINALVTSSDGWYIENPKWYRASQADLRVKQRRLARAKRGSNNRKKRLLEVQRHHQHLVNQRQDLINKLVYNLTLSYDKIAVEDLEIRNMVKNHCLSKSILDAAWGFFKRRLHDKAVEAGREVIEVNPAYTSAKSFCCEARFEDFSLATRVVVCPVCGLELDRDFNAALNILKRAGHVLKAERSALAQACLRSLRL